MQYLRALRLFFVSALFLLFSFNVNALVKPKKIISTVKFPVLIYTQEGAAGAVSTESLKLEKVMEHEVKATYKSQDTIATGRRALTEEEKLSLLDALTLIKPTGEAVVRHVNFESEEIKGKVNQLCRYLCSTVPEGKKSDTEAKMRPVLVSALKQGDMNLDHLQKNFLDIHEYVRRLYAVIQEKMAADTYIKERFESGLVRLILGNFGEEIFRKGSSRTLRRYLDFISKHPDSDSLSIDPEYYHLTCFEVSLDNRILSGVRLILQNNPGCNDDMDTSTMKAGFQNRSELKTVLKKFRSSGMIESSPGLTIGDNFSFGRFSYIKGSMPHLRQPSVMNGKDKAVADALAMFDIRSIIREHELFGIKRTFSSGGSSGDSSGDSSRDNGALFLESSSCEVAKYTPKHVQKHFIADLERSDLFPTLTGLSVSDEGRQLFSRQVCRVLFALMRQADSPFHSVRDLSIPLILDFFSEGNKTVMDLPWLSVKCTSVDYWFLNVTDILGSSQSPGLAIRLNPEGNKQPLVLVIPLFRVKILWHLELPEDVTAATNSSCKVSDFLKQHAKDQRASDSGYSSTCSVLSALNLEPVTTTSFSEINSRLSASDICLTQTHGKRTSFAMPLSSVREHLSPPRQSDQAMTYGLSCIPSGFLARNRTFTASQTLGRERRSRKERQPQFVSRSKITSWGSGPVTPWALEGMTTQIHLYLRTILVEYNDIRKNPSLSIYLDLGNGTRKIERLMEVLGVDNPHTFYCVASMNLRGINQSCILDNEMKQEFTTLDAFEYVYRYIAQNRKKMASYLVTLIKDMSVIEKLKDTILCDEDDD